MSTELEFFVFMVLSFCTGIGVTIAFSLINQKVFSSLETVEESNTNLEEKVLPFIQIHESLIVDKNHSSQDESVNRLKEKIDSFKQRNRFYQS